MQKCAIQAEVRWHTMPSNKREQESWGVYGRWTHECVTGYPNISNGWKLLFQQICKLCHQFSRKRSKCVTTTAPNCLILSFSFCEADVYVCSCERVSVYSYIDEPSVCSYMRLYETLTAQCTLPMPLSSSSSLFECPFLFGTTLFYSRHNSLITDLLAKFMQIPIFIRINILLCCRRRCCCCCCCSLVYL